MYGMLCSLSVVCGPNACLDNFIMLASSVKIIKTWWHGLFVYGSVISVMPESFIFWAFFCTSIAV
jgi:hypothetical protein